MSLRQRITARLFAHLQERIALKRTPDLVIGAESPGGAYLHRWWVIPRNPICNMYLHFFLRDDDDRALHDHPWFWCSFLLYGSYTEHTISAGGIHHRIRRDTGSIKISSPWRAHRIELLPIVTEFGESAWRMPCWTLFITGPRLRSWGFHCAQRGWVHWRDFTAAREGKPGELGAGCEG